MGVGGFQYSHTIYFKTEGEVTKKFRICNRFIHFFRKNFLRNRNNPLPSSKSAIKKRLLWQRKKNPSSRNGS